jgi:Coenzyme PQQ synthesis protein D (PqqD)
MALMQLRQVELTWHVAGDELVILDLQGSVYLKLNGSARVLWERLAKPCTASDLATALIEAYGIDEERAATDVASFLDDLRERRLLTE